MPVCEPWTYGVEHEFADWPLTRKLSPGMTHNRKEYTIVNSSGIANDPKGVLYKFGGELNTAPTNTPQGQADILEAFTARFPEASVNYRSNLHVHVRVPGLRENLPLLKKLQAYNVKWLPRVLPTIDPIPLPDMTARGDRREVEMARYRRRKVSHHHMISDKILRAQLAARTTDEFFASEVPSKNGKPLFHLGTRTCVNLRQLLETDTIEFRHFPGTLDPEELTTTIMWCQSYLVGALVGDFGNASPLKVFKATYDKAKFPSTPLMDYRLEQGYKMTRCDGSISKEQIVANIKRIEAGYLDRYR